VTQEELRRLFESYGQVAQFYYHRGPRHRLPRAFVEMVNDADADKGIQELNDSILRARTLNVEYARPRPERQQLSWTRRIAGLIGRTPHKTAHRVQFSALLFGWRET
jgi:RNA recognition motif-containing protein